jgi:hypothetical protein
MARRGDERELFANSRYLRLVGDETDEIIKAKKDLQAKQKKKQQAAKKAAPAKKVSGAKAAGANKSNGEQKKVVKQQVVAKNAGSSNGAQPKAKKSGGAVVKPRPVDAKNITIQVRVPKPAKSVKVAKPATELDPRKVVIQISTGKAPMQNVKKTGDDMRAKRSAESRQIVQSKREATMNTARAAKKSSAPTSLSDRFSLAASR